MQLHCKKPNHGPYEVPNVPAACPKCLAETGQELIPCDNHGAQVVKVGDSCGFCVMESVADRPLHRISHRETAPIISYFKPTVTRR